MSVYIEQEGHYQNFEGKEIWNIYSEIENIIKNKIINKGKKLIDWDVKINRGVLTGFNEAFIIDEDTKNKLLIEDSKSAEIIRPILRGRDITRFGYEFKNLYLINSHNGIKHLNIPPINIENYPAIKRHLDKFYSDLEKRTDKGDTPYNLRNCVYMDDFNKQKIIYPETTQNARFYLDNNNFYIDKTCFMIISDMPEYLVLTLSSKLFEYAYKRLFSSIELGKDGYQYNKHAILKLPIVFPNKKIIEDAKAIYENFLATNNDSVIDNFIFSLYDLTEEEINYILSNNR